MFLVGLVLDVPRVVATTAAAVVVGLPVVSVVDGGVLPAQFRSHSS